LSEVIESTGTVESILGNNNFRVAVDVPGVGTRSILCHLAGKMRQFSINVVVGDKVKVVIPPPYDKGRITFRENG
jgi:translation initiation factor IF-1